MMGKGEREGRRKRVREGGKRDIQLSNREAKYCNLFRHNRLNRLQREEYSVLGAGTPPPLPPQRICHEELQFADKSGKNRERGASRESSI